MSRSATIPQSTGMEAPHAGPASVDELLQELRAQTKKIRSLVDASTDLIDRSRELLRAVRQDSRLQNKPKPL
jgi:hypothetical protein